MLPSISRRQGTRYVLNYSRFCRSRIQWWAINGRPSSGEWRWQFQQPSGWQMQRRNELHRGEETSGWSVSFFWRTAVIETSRGTNTIFLFVICCKISVSASTGFSILRKAAVSQAKMLNPSQQIVKNKITLMILQNITFNRIVTFDSAYVGIESDFVVAVCGYCIFRLKPLATHSRIGQCPSTSIGSSRTSAVDAVLTGGLNRWFKSDLQPPCPLKVGVAYSRQGMAWIHHSWAHVRRRSRPHQEGSVCVWRDLGLDKQKNRSSDPRSSGKRYGRRGTIESILHKFGEIMCVSLVDLSYSSRWMKFCKLTFFYKLP